MITKTILLINSEPTVRELVQDCLSHLGGWQVFSIDCPAKGLECAARTQPDAIVFDVSTAGMNYLTFLRKLVAQPATQDIPVVLVAAGAKWLDIGLLQQFQVVGAIDDLSDPIKFPQQIAKLLNWNDALELET